MALLTSGTILVQTRKIYQYSRAGFEPDSGFCDVDPYANKPPLAENIRLPILRMTSLGIGQWA